MSEFLLLFKIQLQNYFFKKSNSKKKGLKIGSAFVGLIVIFALSIYYAWIFMDIFSSSKESFFPYFIIYFGFFLTFMYGISNSQGMLFGFKDLDLLRSFPLKESSIIFSKISLFIFIEYLTTGLFILPALIIFGYKASYGFMYYLMLLLGYISFPIIPILLSAVIGIFVKYISAGKKYGNLIQNIGTILFVAVVYYISFKLGYSTGEGTAIEMNRNQGIFKYLITCNWYGEAALENNFISLLLLTVISFALLFVCVKLYSNIIIMINEKANQGYHNKNFKLSKNNKDNSVFGALLKKELNRVLNNFIYLLNTSLGMLILLLGSLYLCFFMRDDLKSLVNSLSFLGGDIKTIVWQVAILIIVSLGQMTCTTGVSISLEGKTMWLLKVLPITVRDIFITKILTNMIIIILPSLVSLILIGITFAFPIQYFIFGIIFILLTSIFISCLGLMSNLLFPKLDYEREAVVIKQSLSAFISIFVPFLLVIGLVILYFVFIEKFNLFYLFMVVYLLLDLLIILYLYTKGAKRFLYEIN